MATICGADCSNCGFKETCLGCEKTCGKPFGKECVAAEFIKACGKEKYSEFKSDLLNKINIILEANGIQKADALYEIVGSFVNLSYPLPNGENARFLDDKKIYLATQIEGENLCYGVVADTSFILVCSYKENGAEPKLIYFKNM